MVMDHQAQDDLTRHMRLEAPAGGFDFGQLRHGGPADLCLVSAQEAEKFDTLAQAPLHHLPAAEHLAHDLPDLAGAEIETFVEHFHAVEDLLLRQMR